MRFVQRVPFSSSLLSASWQASRRVYEHTRAACCTDCSAKCGGILYFLLTLLLLLFSRTALLVLHSLVLAAAAMCGTQRECTRNGKFKTKTPTPNALAGLCEFCVRCHLSFYFQMQNLLCMCRTSGASAQISAGVLIEQVLHLLSLSLSLFWKWILCKFSNLNHIKLVTWTVRCVCVPDVEYIWFVEQNLYPHFESLPITHFGALQKWANSPALWETIQWSERIST